MEFDKIGQNFNQVIRKGHTDFYFEYYLYDSCIKYEVLHKSSQNVDGAQDLVAVRTGADRWCLTTELARTAITDLTIPLHILH